MINSRKLLHHDKVEVRQLEEGLLGSWHSGVVVGVSDSCRKVRYDNLLCESGRSKLVEPIPVTGAIEGLYQRPSVKSNYRGLIRPVPPYTQPASLTSRLKFGACVDVLFKESWWEGVIVDCNDDYKERRVYFPDEDDVRVCKLSDIRVTYEWDEFSGSWRERGTWLLVNLAREHKKEGNLFQLIRRVWSRLKVHYGFQKMVSEWTCGAYCVWKEYFQEVIYEITAKPRAKAGVFSTIHRDAAKIRGSRSKRVSFLNNAVLTRSMQRRKDKEVTLAVRTRGMCMSEPENSPISAATKSKRLFDFQRIKNHSTAVDSCVITESPTADELGESDQIASVYKVDCDVEKREYDHSTAVDSCVITESPTADVRGESDRIASVYKVDCDVEKREYDHGTTSKNPNPHTRSPCCYRSTSNWAIKPRSRRKWRFVGKILTPKKLNPSKISSRLSKRHTCGSSKLTRHVDNRVSLKASDYEPVDNMKRLKQTQMKVGYKLRYFVRRREKRRMSISSIRKKKRSPRIKKIYPQKGELDKNKLNRNLSEELEASKSSQKDDVKDIHCGSTIADPCQDVGSDDGLNDKHRAKSNRYRDSVCFICQYGDELLYCDHCMSSYHLPCVDGGEDTVGRFICPFCRCSLCGLKGCGKKGRRLTNPCYQCSRQYHLACVDQAGISVSENPRFCSKSCFEICARLHQLLRRSNSTSVEGLTWTITRSRRNDCNVYNERAHPLIQVSQVSNVFHECFQPILEPHTGRDLVSDIVYNSGSKFRRLDFHGFYVMALVYNDEVACAATIRIHGQKVAEMPLIATPFKYRRQGMCRLLLHELEKMLVELGVERLVLPGIASLSETWVSSFGFKEMPASVRTELLGYPFVVFQGTTMFEKILSRSFEVPDNAKPCTRGSIKVNEHVASSSNDCDMGRIERPVTRNHSKMNVRNREFPNLKLGTDCEEGSSKNLMKPDRAQLGCSQENLSENEPRKLRQRSKRKKQEDLKGKTVMDDDSDQNQPIFKCVYKRRRIQASRDSSSSSDCL